MTTQIKSGNFKGLILFTLLTMLILNSCMVNAQSSSRELLDARIVEKVKAWEDSMRRLNPAKYPTYLGAEISLAVPQHKLNSNLSQLSGMKVGFIGVNLGGVLANPLGKLKANAGMYYSNSSVPYTIDMLQTGLSASVYFLRLKTVRYHTFEPYATVGFSFQRTGYHGYYLPTTDRGASVSTNYSSTEAPLLGKTGSSFMNLTTGVEYQLESDDRHFIHLFAEISYGLLISSSASNSSFTGTVASNLSALSLGVSFGILK